MRKRVKADNKILVVDIETTGWLKQGGCIVEIGMSTLNLKTGEARIVFDSLLKEKQFGPKHNKKPFGWIFDNSNLTFEEVMDAPHSDDVYHEVQKLIDRYHVGCTAYNRSFDVSFLQDRGIEFGKLLPCPMLQATPVVKCPGKFGNFKWPTVEEAWDFFYPDVEYVEEHRGADDSWHEAKIVNALIQQGAYFDK